MSDLIANVLANQILKMRGRNILGALGLILIIIGGLGRENSQILIIIGTVSVIISIYLNYMNRAGYYKGKHFSTYVDQIKDLISKDEIEKVSILLPNLIETMERESKKKNVEVDP